MNRTSIEEVPDLRRQNDAWYATQGQLGSKHSFSQKFILDIYIMSTAKNGLANLHFVMMTPNLFSHFHDFVTCGEATQAAGLWIMILLLRLI